METLTGTTAFITGAAQGIGLGLARALGRRGARLALTDIDQDALDAAADELGRTADVAAYRLDVRDRDAFADVADRAEAQLGSVSLLCNNAGIAFAESVEDASFRLWDLALGINLGGVVNGVQTLLPRMLARREAGHVINTASAAGLIGAGVGAMYTASKFAVVGLSEALRRQLETGGHPIGVTVLCPGGVATNIARTGQSLVAADAAEEPGRSHVDDAVNRVDSILRERGASPDAVGEAAVAAMLAGRFYVHTDRSGIELIKRRTEEILADMPTAPLSEARFESLREDA